jgi:hypothetical protein
MLFGALLCTSHAIYIKIVHVDEVLRVRGEQFSWVVIMFV